MIRRKKSLLLLLSHKFLIYYSILTKSSCSHLLKYLDCLKRWYFWELVSLFSSCRHSKVSYLGSLIPFYKQIFSVSNVRHTLHLGFLFFMLLLRGPFYKGLVNHLSFKNPFLMDSWP